MENIFLLHKLIFSETGRDACPTSLLQTPNIGNERIDFLFRELLRISRHFAFAITDGVKNPFIAHSVLPFRIVQFARVVEAGLRSFGPPITPVTRSTVSRIQSSSSADVSGRR